MLIMNKSIFYLTLFLVLLLNSCSDSSPALVRKNKIVLTFRIGGMC